jgi:hypothetical protein
MDHGTRKHYFVGVVQSAYLVIPAQASENGKQVRRMAQAAHTSPPPSKRRGSRRAKARFCQGP